MYICDNINRWTPLFKISRSATEFPTTLDTYIYVIPKTVQNVTLNLASLHWLPCCFTGAAKSLNFPNCLLKHRKAKMLERAAVQCNDFSTIENQIYFSTHFNSF